MTWSPAVVEALTEALLKGSLFAVVIWGGLDSGWSQGLEWTALALTCCWCAASSGLQHGLSTVLDQYNLAVGYHLPDFIDVRLGSLEVLPLPFWAHACVCSRRRSAWRRTRSGVVR